MLGLFIRNVADNTNSSLDYFHLIGHSLGAHVVGYAGKFLDGKLAQITGLDPAGPMFEGVKNPKARLWYTDASFVDSVHTDAVSGIPNYGTYETCSHVSIFPNGGKEQPGCPPISYSHTNNMDSNLIQM